MAAADVVPAGLPGGGEHRRCEPEQGHHVLDDPGRDGTVRCRLIATPLDPKSTPATELAALCAEYWEAEGILKEIKTAQLGTGQVPASKTRAGLPGLYARWSCRPRSVR